MNQFLTGVLIGAAAIQVVFTATPGGKLDLYNKAIEKCEKSLPRDQKCEITAIPKVNP